MRELSLNILDIAQNSVAAGARNISVSVGIDTSEDVLRIKIADDGRGMEASFLESVCDPFTTTRETRKAGLGLPLFKMAAEMAGGTFSISSAKGKGTTVEASFTLSHIDRMPLGDLGETMLALILGAPEIDYLFEYGVGPRKFILDTRAVKEQIQGLPIDSPEIAGFLQGLISENITDLNGGNTY